MDFETQSALPAAQAFCSVTPVSEFVAGRDMESCFKSAAHLSVLAWLRAHPCSWMLDIGRGLAHLHAERDGWQVIHCDLAARNILIDTTDEKRARLRISDFDLARAIRPRSVYHESSDRATAWSWSAPESIQDGHYSAASDVWSFGVTVWEILTECKEEPLKDLEVDLHTQQQFVDKQKQMAQHHQLPSGTDSWIAALLDRCWQMNARDRPTAAEIVALLEQQAVSSATRP